MKLEKAKAIANEVIERLRPYCSQIMVAGSVRRRKAQVKDIDILLIPANAGQ